MTYYTQLGTRLVFVDNNKELIVGQIHEAKLLNEIVALLNGEH